MGARLDADQRQGPPQRGIKYLFDEGRLPRTADSRDDAQAPNGDAETDVLEIVGSSPRELEPGARRWTRRTFDSCAVFNRTSRGGPRVGEDYRRRPLDDDVPAVAAPAGTEIDEMVGSPNRLRVVLHDEYGRAHRRQSSQILDQALRVPRMQSDRRLIEHVEGARQPAAKLCAQPEPLHLAPRETRSRSTESATALGLPDMSTGTS